MNFEHDLAQLAKCELNRNGVTLPKGLTDVQICVKAFEIHQRWFDSSVSYGVVYSREFRQKMERLTPKELDAICDIENSLRNCKSLTPYMSKNIKAVSVKKSDFMQKCWNIYHLHLEKAEPDKAFNNGKLLFFIPKGRVVHFIDIKPHPKGSSWFDRDLLNTIYENWPYLLIYKEGYTPTINLSDSEMFEAQKCMFVPVQFKSGILFPTNMGVMASGDSARASMDARKLLYQLSEAEDYLIKNEAHFKQQITQTMGLEVSEPLDYDLIVENGCFVALEKNTQAKVQLFEAI